MKKSDKVKKKNMKRASSTPTASRLKKRSRFEPMGAKSMIKPKVRRMAGGGMCRGMGKASKGGRYSRSM